MAWIARPHQVDLSNLPLPNADEILRGMLRLLDKHRHVMNGLLIMYTWVRRAIINQRLRLNSNRPDSAPDGEQAVETERLTRLNEHLLGRIGHQQRVLDRHKIMVRTYSQLRLVLDQEECLRLELYLAQDPLAPLQLLHLQHPSLKPQARCPRQRAHDPRSLVKLYSTRH